MMMISREINGSNFPNKSCTLKAMFIVKDPRDVAISYARHYGKGINDTVQSMLDTHNMSHGDKQIEFLSSWKMHVISWQKRKFPKLLMRYEDLLENTELEIRSLLNFLALTPKISVAELGQATSFATLKSKETKVGFTEAVDKKMFSGKENPGMESFFWAQISPKWRQSLLTLLNNSVTRECIGLRHCVT